jgi:GNAT superfamily N-acetyltransferase
MSLVVRPATVDDAAAIDRVRFASWRAAYGGLVPESVFDEWDHAALTRRLRTRLASRTTRGCIAEQDGTIVGFCTYGDSRDDDLPDAAEVYGIYVHPDAWSAGAGRALLGAAVDAVAGRPVLLWVLRDNARARRFYQIAGWRPDGASREITIGGTPLAEVRYRLA